MVSKQDLVDTVTAAYSAGWRQVKLYFMVGLPTETDEDVLEIAEMARDVIRAGRAGHRHPRRPLHRVASAASCPRPHTPFQWASQLDHETTDRRLKLLRSEIQSRQEHRQGDRLPLPRRQARASSRACCPAATVASARVLEQVWTDGGRFDGWSEHFSYDRWMAAAEHGRASTSPGTRRASARRARSCPGTTSTPGSTRSGCGRDWQDALAEQDLDDCRWIPCFDCGVCPQMGTDIQIGPTGKTLLPLTVVKNPLAV